MWSKGGIVHKMKIAPYLMKTVTSNTAGNRGIGVSLPVVFSSRQVIYGHEHAKPEVSSKFYCQWVVAGETLLTCIGVAL